MANPLENIWHTEYLGVPAPMWGVGVLAAAMLAYRFSKNKSAAATATAATDPNAATTPSGTFDSGNTQTTTTTDPTTGNSTTQSTNYNATAQNYTPMPELGTQYANPMPYSGGDVYVNYPQQQETPQTMQGPPLNPPAAISGTQGSYWYTLPNDVSAQNLVDPDPGIGSLGYGLGPLPGPPDVSSRTNDSMLIMKANPQVNWSQGVKAGTPIFIPLTGGITGKPGRLPKGASQAYPLSTVYWTGQPTQQQTTQGAYF